MIDDQNPPENPEEGSFMDDVNDAANEAGESIEEAAETIKEETKSTVDEMKEGFKEVTGSQDNKKMLAGLLAIFLGSFGVHKFILGYQKEGVILLVATVIGYILTCFVVGIFVLVATGAIGLIEGIIYLTKTDEDFYNTYQVGNKPWF